jgi:MYXO-CTERM domain-containing protein
MALAMAVGDGYGADTAQVIATLADTTGRCTPLLLHCIRTPASARPAAVNIVRGDTRQFPSPASPQPRSERPALHGFTTHNRFIRGKAPAYVGPPGCVGIRYHGLDYMLLHNLYAIATPGTWNGDPNADPCAVVPDGAATTGDAGTQPDAGETSSSPGGCGCGASDHGAPALFGIALVWILRRKRVSGRSRRS